LNITHALVKIKQIAEEASSLSLAELLVPIIIVAIVIVPSVFHGRRLHGRLQLGLGPLDDLVQLTTV
jgi:hypothetical protein